MKICIIGSGAAGLCALKKSLDEGHICEAFEQTGTIGGTWNYTDSVGKDEYGLPIHSSMYKELRTNLPKEVMEFDDFSYKGIKESYINAEQVLQYMLDYASHFNLYPHIKFHKEILHVEPEVKNRWLVKIRDVETNITEDKIFDYVIVCSGHYKEPNMPEVRGIETFPGTCIHSHSYRTVEPYRGKVVLIVGAGPSGVDIARLVSSVAKKIILSYKTLKFKIQDMKRLIEKPLINEVNGNLVKFTDGTAEEVDDIIFCTGYLYSFPFLSKRCKIEVQNNYIRYLYKDLINVEYTNMVFLGIPSAICPFPGFCLQMNFILSTINGHFKLPLKEDMLKDIQKEEEIRNVDQKYLHTKGGDLEEKYFDDLAETANIEKMPRFVLNIHECVRKNGRNFSDCFRIINKNSFELIK